MMSDPRWGEALARLPDYLGSHLRVSAAALALGLLVSFPLALAVRNRPALRGAFLAVASIVQTVPGLALLALFYPLLLILSAWSLQWFGVSFSAFGFIPSVLALALYSMLPVLRNTVTGLQGVDPAILEAAQGAGMTPRQSLTMVELPLALPVIMAGVRTAAVWVIGTATLVDADRPDQPGQLHLHRPADAELGVRAVRLRRGRRPCARRRSTACTGRQRHPQSLDVAQRAWRRGPCAADRRCLHSAAGTNAQRLYRRRKDLHRVLRAVEPDRAKAGCRRLARPPARGARLERHLRSAARERDRRLCRLLRHAVGEPAQAHRHQAAAGDCRRTEDGAARAIRRHAARRSRLRKRLRAGDAAQARRGARHPQHRRSRPPLRELVDRRRLRVLLAARNGRRCATPMA